MGREIILVMAVLLITGTATSACHDDQDTPYHAGGYTLAQLQSDFDEYVGLIRRDHPLTFTDLAVLDEAISTQRSLLREEMTELEFYRVVAPVGAAVRCGHTRTYLSEQGRDYLEEHGECLPLEIRLLSDSVYVYKDFTPEKNIPRGSRVISIDGLSATEIIARMRDSLYADGTNITYKDYAINLFFARWFALLVGEAPQFEMEIMEPDSQQAITRIVNAMTLKDAGQVNRDRYPQDEGCRRLCMTFASDNSHAVLTIKDFGYYDNLPAFRQPVGEFFARLDSAGIEALIIDLRGNDGGDPYCSSFVVNQVLAEPVRYFATGTPFYEDLVRPLPVPRHVFTGKLIVLTDGWCFSSTGHMLSLLRCHRRGIVVGEESGGSSACNDASQLHTLQHTRLRLNLPRRTFATSARCLPLGRGIPPDIEVRPAIQDLIAGRDVVLERAISLAVQE